MILNISIPIEEYEKRYVMFPLGSMKLSPKQVTTSYLARTQGTKCSLATQDEELYAKLIDNNHLISVELQINHNLNYLPKIINAKTLLTAIEIKEAIEGKKMNRKTLNIFKKKQYFITEK